MKFEEFHRFIATAAGYALLMLLGLVVVLFIIGIFCWWKDRRKS